MISRLMGSAPHKRPSRILVAAGGTGGHISPGRAIAETLREKGQPVVFATLSQNAEYPDISGMDPEIPRIFIPAPRLPGSPLKLPGFLWYTFVSVMRLIRSGYRIKAVIGMGGYPTVPVLLYALLTGKRIFLCDQNATPGLVTKLFGRFAARIYLAFPVKLSGDVLVSGNPLRAAFRTRPPQDTQARHILFLGGSQGAREINEAWTEWISRPTASEVRTILISGKTDYDQVRAYSRPQDQVFDFVTNMPELLSASIAIVSRAGSGTLFEILWARRPALLVPYPFAADDHQRANARFLAKSGLVSVTPKGVSTAGICDLLDNLLARANFESMQDKMAHHDLPLDAHLRICQDLLGRLE